MRTYTLQVLIDNRKGTDIPDAARRLAKRLEAIGLVGMVEQGFEDGDPDNAYGMLEVWPRVEFGKKEG